MDGRIELSLWKVPFSWSSNFGGDFFENSTADTSISNTVSLRLTLVVLQSWIHAVSYIALVSTSAVGHGFQRYFAYHFQMFSILSSKILYEIHFSDHNSDWSPVTGRFTAVVLAKVMMLGTLCSWLFMALVTKIVWLTYMNTDILYMF